MPILTRRSLLKSAGSLAGVSVAAHRGRCAGQRRGCRYLTLVCADYVRYMHIASGDVKPDGRHAAAGSAATARRCCVGRRRTDRGRRGVVDGAARRAHRQRRPVDGGDADLPAAQLHRSRRLHGRPAPRSPRRRFEGKRLGIYGWAASGAVWKRHMMRWNKQDPAKVTWVVGDADIPSTGTGPANLPPLRQLRAEGQEPHRPDGGRRASPR